MTDKNAGKPFSIVETERSIELRLGPDLLMSYKKHSGTTAEQLRKARETISHMQKFFEQNGVNYCAPGLIEPGERSMKDWKPFPGGNFSVSCGLGNSVGHTLKSGAKPEKKFIAAPAGALTKKTNWCAPEFIKEGESSVEYSQPGSGNYRVSCHKDGTLLEYTPPADTKSAPKLNKTGTPAP